MISNALKIKGFMSETELQWLADMARECETIIEIGSYHGRSTRALADNTKGKVYCIDPWPGVMHNIMDGVSFASGEYVFRQFQKNLKDHIDTGKVNIHRGTVQTFDLVRSADFVFIDGNHLPEPFIMDLEFADKMVARGIVSGHDYGTTGWPAVKELVDVIHPTARRCDTIWWIRRS